MNCVSDIYQNEVRLEHKGRAIKTHTCDVHVCHLKIDMISERDRKKYTRIVWGRFVNLTPDMQIRSKRLYDTLESRTYIILCNGTSKIISLHHPIYYTW